MSEGHKERSPDLGQEIRASEGVDALPARLDRYAKAKNRAIDVAQYIGAHRPQEAKLAQAVSTCGSTCCSGTTTPPTCCACMLRASASGIFCAPCVPSDGAPRR